MSGMAALNVCASLYLYSKETAMPSKVPPYLRHKSKNLAYVNFAGRVLYLGKYGSPKSRKKYARMINEWVGGDGRPPSPNGATVADMFAGFWAHAKNHYVKAGQATSELSNYRAVGRLLLDLYDDMPAADFGPRQLKACREVMIGLGWFRQSINRQVSRMRTIFRWGVAEEIIPADRFESLKAVSGLRAGRPGVRESEPVRPVPSEHIRRTMPALPPIIRAMVRVQKLTGMRSGELVAMRPELIDQTGKVWLYNAPSKTEHHGYDRLVEIGPRAQRILRLLIARTGDDEYIFRPVEAYDWHAARRHAARKTPLGQGNRPGKSNRPRKRRRSFRESFTSDTYRQAIRRACLAAGVPHWHPHQLRHNAATRINADYGIEAVRVVLGHATLKMAEHYAERDHVLARRVALEVG